MYSFSQDADYVSISPNQMRMCDSSGQSAIPNNVDAKSVNAMNLVFTGSISGNVLSGQWLVCATGSKAWLPKPVSFTLSADGKHLSGQLDEMLNFDRM